MSEPYLTTALSDTSNRARNRRRAAKLLADFRRGDPAAIDLFRQNHPQGAAPDFQPQMIDARIVSVSENVQPKPLSLPTLKKRAKRLLKAWRAQEVEAISRAENAFSADRQPTPEVACLADAQFIIARELGLKSWPRLKAHLTALRDASATLRAPASGAADQGIAHIRCGSDIEAALPSAGLTGQFLNFEEIYVCGPLIGGADGDLRPFLQRRAEYLSASFADGPDAQDRDMSVAGVLAGLERDRQQISELAQGSDSVSLWFEHDAHDQFMLAALLHQLAVQSDDCPARLHLISPDRYPGVDRFMGLGQLAGDPASLRLLWDQRVDVSGDEMAAGAETWRAMCDPDPAALWRIAIAGTSPLRHMPGALRWHLAQLPHIAHGLSGVEYQMLQVVAADGPLTAGRLFALHLYEADPLPTLGDLVFFNILDGLINTDRPALEYLSYDPEEAPHRRGDLTLTDIGHQLLAGTADWLELNPIDRWVGAVRVVSGQQNWRWDPGVGPILH